MNEISKAAGGLRRLVRVDIEQALRNKMSGAVQSRRLIIHRVGDGDLEN
jgi:hypothetical protein